MNARWKKSNLRYLGYEYSCNVLPKHTNMCGKVTCDKNYDDELYFFHIERIDDDLPEEK